MSQLFGRRWLSVILRSLHLVAVTLLGAAIHGAPFNIPTSMFALATLISGGVMFVMDLTGRRDHWREAAGLGVIVKLGLIALLAIVPQMEKTIFWSVLIWSAMFSHAPAAVRHRVLIQFGTTQGPTRAEK
jgi:hypothetical protein